MCFIAFLIVFLVFANKQKKNDLGHYVRTFLKECPFLEVLKKSSKN